MMSTTPTPESLKELVEKEIKEIDFPKKPAGLYEPIRYALEAGGKRLRPVLMLATAYCFGEDVKKIMPQALSLEVLHNFTLLHDDIMDKSSTRHGLPTVHVKWNVSTAILSGDAMLTISNILALKNLPHDKVHSVMSLINETSLKIYEGQQHDMDFENSINVSEKDYEEMILLKTGVLIGCACGMGALLAVDGNDKNHDKIVKETIKLGYTIGMAFQLQDDKLDTYGDGEVFGKPIGGDIVNDKKTWLLVNALESKYKNKLEGILNDTTIADQEKVKEVMAIYNALSLEQKISEKIGKYYDEAARIIDSLEKYMPKGGQLLRDILSGLINRKK